MADAMMEAFKKEYPNFIGGPAPDDTKQMKLLFVAVAQGMVRHLVANKDAFRINVQNNSSHAHNANISNIETTGTLY